MLIMDEAKKPFVTVVVATWLPENKHYLDLCIQSVNNSDYPKDLMEIILVGKPGYLPEYQGVRTISPTKNKFYCSEGMNFGAAQASPDAQYLLLLNDDVVLTKECLSRLVNTSKAGGDNLVTAPICNTDNNLQFTLFFGYEKNGKWEPLPEHWIRYEDIENDIPAMINAKSMYNCGMIWTDHLCMSSPLIPMKIWKRLGGFDEEFHGGADDIDFCIRASQLGYKLGIALDSLAFHFGSVTINKTVDTETWLYNTDLFVKKHGSFPIYVTQERYDKIMKLHAEGK